MAAPDPPAPPRTLGDLYVLLVALFGALWTVLCHAVVFAHGNFFRLQQLAPLVCALWGALAAVLVHRDRRLLDDGLRRLRTRHWYRHHWPALAAAALAYAIVLLISRWDQDQTFYVSIPVFTLDHPSLPLLGQDTMLGYPGVPLLSDPYRFHSLELLAAWLASLLPIHPVQLLHGVFPIVYVPLCLIGWHGLLRHLLPSRSEVGLLLVVVFCLFFAEANESPANMALVRLDDGKNVVYFAIIPLVYRYSLDLLCHHRPGSWWVLALLSIFSLGLSSSSLFLLPLQLGVLSLIAWRPKWPIDNDTLWCAANGLSAVYLLVAAVAMRRVMTVPYAVLPDSNEPVLAYWAGVHGKSGLLLLASLLLLWRLFEERDQRRLLLLLPLPFLALMLIPPLAHWTSRHVTSPVLFSRISWPLPVLAYVALLAIKLHERLSGARRVVVLGLLAAAIVPFPIFAPENRLELKPSLMKADTRLYSLAGYLFDHQPPGTSVLAPEEVAMYLTWMHHHPPLVCDRSTHLYQANEPFGEDETRARGQLQNAISSTVIDPTFDAAWFEQWVRRLAIGSVTIREPELRPALLAETLRRLGFVPVHDLQHSRYSTCYWCHTPGAIGDIHYQVWIAAGNGKRPD